MMEKTFYIYEVVSDRWVMKFKSMRATCKTITKVTSKFAGSSNVLTFNKKNLFGYLSFLARLHVRNSMQSRKLHHHQCI